MKKALLYSAIILLFTSLSAIAYETIIIKYPDGELWLKAYYKKRGNEAILQYLPKNQTRENWKRSIIVHSYNHLGYSVSTFMGYNLSLMQKTNPTGQYKYLKSTPDDMIATRCTNNYKDIKAQCDFFRTSRAHDRIITVHYINRDKKDFKNNYTQWFEIIKRAKFYNSYYRDERTFDKSEYFEL